MTKAFYITAAELAQMGKDNITDELLSAKHLIYSSLQHWRSIHRERRALV